jgi:hypothetical protein
VVNTFAVTIFGTSFVALAVPGPAAGQEPPGTAFSTPFSQVIENPCTAETVFVNGTMTIVQSSFADGTGKLHEKLGLATNGVGESLSTGVRYTFSEEFEFEQENPFPGQTGTTSSTFNQHLIGADPDDNFVFKLTAHLTIHPDGTRTGDVGFISCQCRGAGGAKPQPEVSCVPIP